MVESRMKAKEERLEWRERVRERRVGPRKILRRDTGEVSNGALFYLIWFGWEIMWSLAYLGQVGES